MTGRPRPQPAAVQLPSHARHVLGSLAAGLGLLTLLVGVPILLNLVAGFPLPDRLPTWEDVKVALLTRDDGQLFLATLTWLAWATWALLVVLVALEAVAQLRGRPTPRIPGLRPAQWLARALVTGVTAAVLATPSTLARSPAPPLPVAAASAPPPSSAATANPVAESEAATVESVTDTAPATPTGEQPVYVVKPRDTLWGIAERFLGDGERYGEIARLNYGRPQPDGHALTSSHRIYPGWQLLLPADAHTPAEGDGRRWYVVQPGDTLSSIAAHRLGNRERYREIAHLNHGRPQPDGGRLTDPDAIRPGWRLLLPDTGNHDGRHPSSGRPNKPADPDRTTSPSPTQPPTRPPEPSPSQPRPSPPPKASAKDSRTGSPTSQLTSSPTARHPTPARSVDHGRPSQVITLPSGALAGGTLAVAVGAAITAVYLRRRRRYRPLTDPPATATGPETNPTARRLRRAYLRDLANVNDDTQHADEEQVAIDHAYARRRGTTVAGEVPIAARDGKEIALALPTLEGLGLHGPGADSAARALLTTALAIDTVEIVTTDADLRRLLAADDLNAVALPPTVTITPTMTAAVERVETEILHRSRLLTSYDAPDLDTLRRDHPDEPVTTLIVLASLPDQPQPRLTAALALARSHHIGAILLGTWPHGTSCHLEATGKVTAVSGTGSDQLNGNRLFQLSPADAADLLAVLAEATTPNPAADEARSHDERRSRDYAPPVTALDTVTSDALVQLDVLGPVRVSTHGIEIATGLRTKARELLAYLATQPDGVTLDQAITDCWAQTMPEHAANQFRTVIGNIRATLRNATGDRHAKFVTYTAGRYQLDPGAVDVDLWRFTRYLHTHDGHDPVDALTQAVAAYRGRFTVSHDYAWAEPIRESLHREALDAYVRLADEHHRRGEIDNAITDLDRALKLDPYNEDLYQRCIRYLGELGRTDTIRRLHRQLENHLADLDVDPDPTTKHLVTRYLANRSTRPNRQ